MSSSTKVKKEVKLVKKDHPLYEIRKMKHIVKVPRGVSKKHFQIVEDVFVTMTPINTINPASEFGVSAKHDYIAEEAKFYGDGGDPRWDDGRGSRVARVDELFCFCHNQKGKDIAEFFYVIGKKPSSERPDTWIIKAHSDRAVIVLSRYFGYASVTDLMVAFGSRPSREEGNNCLRGTERRKIKHGLKIWLE